MIYRVIRSVYWESVKFEVVQSVIRTNISYCLFHIMKNIYRKNVKK